MTKIYRDYDQAELDRQYDQATLVPDLAPYNTVWVERSAAARKALAHQADVAYGQHPREKLDVFPAGNGRAPAFVFFHGGAWRALDKERFSLVAPPLVEAGIAVVVAGFALLPNVSLDIQVHQARSAFAWAWREGGKHGIDPDRLFVAGHSSGGHLAGVVSTTDWTEWGLPADAVKGTVSVSGMYDLEPVRLSARNKYAFLNEEAVRRYSAVNFLSNGTGPALIAWGDGELDEFKRQSRDFVALAQSRGRNFEGREIAGRNHFAVVEEMFMPGGQLAQAMIEMVRSVG